MSPTLYESLRKDDETLAEELGQVRREAAKIWQEQRLSEFTAHGPDHIRQVERNLDVLTEVLRAGEHRLRPHEIYVLLAACHLHDVGMQLDVPDARKKHAQYSYELILYSRDSADRELNIKLSISNRNAREAVALVSRGHWTSYALALDEESFLFNNEKGCLKLLGLLLATADLLDLSPVRARYFQSVHRLDNLNALGELHQTLHKQVHGCEIVRPDPQVPEELRFEVNWHDENEEIRLLSDWCLHNLTAYWRPMAGALYRESRGTVRWCRPWARAILHPPRGPRVVLAPAARLILERERAEQWRIDRDDFVEDFLEALEERRTVLFVLPAGKEDDGERMADWCEAAARERNARVAGVRPQSTDIVDVRALVSEALAQWQSPGETLADLRALVTDPATDDLVLVLKAEDNIEDVLQAFYTGSESVDGTRFAVLMGTYIPDLDVEIRPMSRAPIPREDLERHLRESWGFDATESTDLARQAAELELGPGLLYAWARQRGRRWETTGGGSTRDHPGEH